MVFVGIDPSLRSTGFSVIRQESDDFEGGRIPTGTKEEPEAFAMIFKKIYDLVKALKDESVIVAIEGISLGYGGKSSGFTSVVEVVGVVKAAAYLAGALAVVLVPAMTWKSTVLGPKQIRQKKIRKDDKAVYLGMIADATGYTADNSDEADAIAIAWFVRGIVTKWPAKAPESHQKIYQSLVAQMARGLHGR